MDHGGAAAVSRGVCAPGDYPGGWGTGHHSGTGRAAAVKAPDGSAFAAIAHPDSDAYTSHDTHANATNNSDAYSPAHDADPTTNYANPHADTDTSACHADATTYYANAEPAPVILR